MWKILGKDTIYLGIGDTAKERMEELAGEGEKADIFRDILDKSEIQFLLNGATEYSSFLIKVPDEITPEQIQIMADVALEIAKNAETPFITANNVEQRYLIIFTNDKEPELIGIEKTPGMSSGAIFKPIFESLDSPGKMNSKYL